MGDIARGINFGATEQVTAAKLHALVDDATVSSIVAADITDGVITNAKISDVAGNKFTGLANIPAGSGVIPVANTNACLLSDAQTVAGVKTFSSSPIVPTPTTDMQASTKKYVDDKAPVFSGSQAFTGNGTFTPGAGINTIFVNAVGGGGGGGGGWNNAGGGGGAGAYVRNYLLPVVASTGYAITIGNAGSGGGAGANGTDGTATTVAYAGSLTLTCAGGIKGIAGNTGTGGSGGTGTNVTITASGATGGSIAAGSTTGMSGANGNGDSAAGGGGGGGYWGTGGAGQLGGVGLAGSGYGSGGGGGCGGGAQAGGNGTPGYVLIYW